MGCCCDDPAASGGECCSLADTLAVGAGAADISITTLGAPLAPTSAARLLDVRRLFSTLQSRWEIRTNNASGTTLFGTTATSNGNAALKSVTAGGNPYTQLPLTEYQTTTPANNASGWIRTANNVTTFGNGWDVWWEVGSGDVSAGATMVCWLGDTVSNTIQPSANDNFAGFGFDASDANWQFMHNDAAGAATKIDTGIPKPSAAREEVFLMRASKVVGQVAIDFAIIRLSDGMTFSGTTGTSNIPADTVLCTHGAQQANPGALTTAILGLSSLGGSSYYIAA